MAQQSRDDEEMITGINVTPLVDVSLVLLVILMVTATYIASRNIPLDLPKAASGESSSSPLAISIDRSGATFLDGQRVDTKALRAGVRRQKAGHASAVIAADGACRHRTVVAVIDLLRQEGVTQLAINVQPQDIEP